MICAALRRVSLGALRIVQVAETRCDGTYRSLGVETLVGRTTRLLPTIVIRQVLLFRPVVGFRFSPLSWLSISASRHVETFARRGAMNGTSTCTDPVTI